MINCLVQSGCLQAADFIIITVATENFWCARYYVKCFTVDGDNNNKKKYNGFSPGHQSWWCTAGWTCLLSTGWEAGGGQDVPEVPPASRPPLKVPLLPPLALIQRPRHWGRRNRAGQSRSPSCWVERERSLGPRLLSCPFSDREGSGRGGDCHQEGDWQHRREGCSRLAGNRHTPGWGGRASHPSALSLSWN